MHVFIFVSNLTNIIMVIASRHSANAIPKCFIQHVIQSWKIFSWIIVLLWDMFPDRYLFEGTYRHEYVNVFIKHEM